MNQTTVTFLETEGDIMSDKRMLLPQPKLISLINVMNRYLMTPCVNLVQKIGIKDAISAIALGKNRTKLRQLMPSKSSIA